jgi:CRP-like cAMP-binding protein
LSIEVGGRIQTMLTDGAFFGEVALLALLDGQQDAKRSATCTAVTYSDVCCITRDDFEHISREYPELLDALKTQGTNLSIKQKKQGRRIRVADGRRKLVRKGSVLNMVVVPSVQAMRSGAEETEALNSSRGTEAKTAFARFHKEGSGKIRHIVPSRESVRASAEAAQTRKHSC